MDLVGRTIRDAEREIVDVYEEYRLAEDRRLAAEADEAATAAAARRAEAAEAAAAAGEEDELVDNPMLEGLQLPKPQFRAEAVMRDLPAPAQSKTGSLHHNRLQDKELYDMGDTGQCMSMHQPYASLLVGGIKMHEGRAWYTPHRGRLWIAAAAKVLRCLGGGVEAPPITPTVLAGT